MKAAGNISFENTLMYSFIKILKVSCSFSSKFGGKNCLALIILQTDAD